jgi:hypothetical protein
MSTRPAKPQAASRHDHMAAPVPWRPRRRIVAAMTIALLVGVLGGCALFLLLELL